MEPISIEQWAAECRQRIAEREDMPISTLAPRNRPMRGLDENAGDVDSGVIGRRRRWNWLFRLAKRVLSPVRRDDD